MWRSGEEDFSDYYPIRPECQADVPKPHFKPRHGKTLSSRRWHDAFSEEGHLDIERVLRRIQRGGIHPLIKGVVWEFLLGCYSPNSTYRQRSELRLSRREQYAKWKEECKSIVPIIGSGTYITTAIITDDGQPAEPPEGEPQKWCLSAPVQDEKLIQWMLSLPQIGLDVARTDRALVYYENESHRAKLWDILAVYAWLDNDISYVQGMNDICSPMVILHEDEADAFWCFKFAMRRLRANFVCSTTSIGVQTQLGVLSQVIKTVDPKLHQHLEDLDGGEYLFAFRMLMVLFRREFTFVDSMYLWEMMWSMEYNPNMFSNYEEQADPQERALTRMLSKDLLKKCGTFERNSVMTGSNENSSALAIFLVASVLENKNKRILKEARGLDDVVQIMGDITGNLDAKKVCREAVKLHKKYLNKASSQPSVRTSVIMVRCYGYEEAVAFYRTTVVFTGIYAPEFMGVL